jgi:hypothetical protein
MQHGYRVRFSRALGAGFDYTGDYVEAGIFAPYSQKIPSKVWSKTRLKMIYQNEFTY